MLRAESLLDYSVFTVNARDILSPDYLFQKLVKGLSLESLGCFSLSLYITLQGHGLSIYYPRLVQC